jgi:hypothetical protein
MPDPVSAAVAVGGQVVGSAIQSRAAGKAAGAQSAAAQAGIDEQRRQFEEMQRLLQPYIEAGTQGLGGQRAFLGLEGTAPQAAAIEQISKGPLLQALTQQGEQALLQQASATGGLRGGNIQGALAQFRPAMLQAALDQQYARLGGLSEAGRVSSTQLGQAGLGVASNIGILEAQQGAAEAGGIIGRAAPFVALANAPAQYTGFQIGRGGPSVGSLFGGRPAAPAASGWTSGFDLPMGR